MLSVALIEILTDARFRHQHVAQVLLKISVEARAFRHSVSCTIQR